MSASTLPLPFLVPGSQASQAHVGSSKPKMVRRRPDMQQGRALETLGHAIEYLVDSRMFLVNEPWTLMDADAVQILSCCSREVFATCAEVIPVHQRFRQWAAGRLRPGAMDQASARRI